MADTRKDKRAPVSLKVRFKSATVDEFIEHYSKDVSRGGIYIKSSQPMPVGTLLKFQFQLKDESALIRGVGRVVWTRVEEDATADNPAGMGIKFIKMDNESRAMVERIIESHDDVRGTYESGRFNASSAEPSSSPPGAGEGGSFFPDLPPAELPLPEDRTAVRHATEFLAAALTEGGSDEAAAREAQAKAEEARKRTEEVEAQRREEAEAKKKQEAEARASLRPKPAEPEPAETAQLESSATFPSASEDDADETAPTPRSLPSMIIDPSLAPRAGRPSEQAAGSDVTPLPRPHAAVQALPKVDLPEPDTEPPPPMESAPRDSTTSISQVNAAPRRSYLPLVVLAAVLLVAAIVFMRGSSNEQEAAPVDDKPLAQDESARENAAQPAPAEPPAEPAPVAEEPAAPTPEPTEPQPAAVAPTEAPANVALVALEVSTVPRGAEVWEGDEKRGPAPLTLKLPLDTPVVVRAVAPGYSEAREELTPKKKGKLALKLVQLPYSVRIESTPPGAAVTVGAHKGVTPVDIALAPPPTGMLAVHAKLDGYADAQTKLKLDAFSESEGTMRAQLNLTLEPSLPKDSGKEAAPAPAPKEKPKKAPAAPAKAQPKAQPAPASDKPAEATPEEPKPEAKPVEAAPVEAKPEAKPVEAAPAEVKPAEAKPAEAKPAPKPGERLPDNPFGE